MKSFFQKISKTFPSALEQMVGYSELELRRMERMYGIAITGNFKEFMLRAGRYSGGLFGDDPLIIYRPSWSIRDHLVFQFCFISDVQDLKKFNVKLNSPFVFSWAGENAYYYLQTKGRRPDEVYVYDEDGETVQSTEMSFEEYLFDELETYPPGGPKCQGELIDLGN